MSHKTFIHKATIVTKPAPPEPPREEPDWGNLLILYAAASFIWGAIWQLVIGVLWRHG